MSKRAMTVGYYIWEKNGQPTGWVVQEGDAQTNGDFLTEEERSQESLEESKARADATAELVCWAIDRSQPLPSGWRRAQSDEIASIHVALSERLRARMKPGGS